MKTGIIKRYITIFIITLSACSILLTFGSIKANVYAAGGSDCRSSSFFGLPTWYEYLNCDNKGVPIIPEKSDKILTKVVGPIALAVVDILLHLAGIIAVAFVIWGGIRYTTSQGSPEGTKSAKDTITNALIGVVIAVLAVVIVNFIGSQFR